MTKLLFIRKPHVYLPEVVAYKAYLARHHPDIQIFESTELEAPFNPNDFDILWQFMGVNIKDLKALNRYVVQEYNSLSTPPLVWIKNKIKRRINAKPDQRVFLSPLVQNAFNFTDDIPAFTRDMGIAPVFFEPQKRGEPEFDLVYAGSLNRGALITMCFDRIMEQKDLSLLVIGTIPDSFKTRYGNAKNITFTGRVPYEEVPQNMVRARYGLNIMPDMYPYNRQTATKVLEYCAVGLPVVSTRYAWSEQFARDRNAQFFYLDEDLLNLTKANLDKHHFKTPAVGDLIWDSVIKNSGIFAFLEREALYFAA